MDLGKLINRSRKLRRALEARLPGVVRSIEPTRVVSEVTEYGLRGGSTRIIRDLINALKVPQKSEATIHSYKKAIERAAAKKTARAEPEESKHGSLRQEPIHTRTMAQILAKQGQFARALAIYDVLLEGDPDNLDLIREIEEIQKAKVTGLNL